MSKAWHNSKKGPGRTAITKQKDFVVNPPGTKLIKRFIKQATGEATAYRKDLSALGVKVS